MNIEYKISTASQDQICNLLLSCDEYFIPRLSDKINIKNYSNKIFSNSINFEAWDNERLIGLIAMYVNNNQENFGYITNVSVQVEYANKGIASNLLINCIKYAREKFLDKINLEVNENNMLALKLYNKFEFKIYEKKKSSKLMSLQLN